MDLAKHSYEYWKDKDKKAENIKKKREIMEFNEKVKLIKANAEVFNLRCDIGNDVRAFNVGNGNKTD